MRVMGLKRLFCFMGMLMCAGNVIGQHMNEKDAPCQGIGPAAAVTQCIVADSQNIEKELKVALEKIRNGLSAADQNRLQIAQRLWVQYRQANCEAERGLYDGGSAAPSVYYACLASDTRQRITELNTMY